jgi:hypothetical protein
VLNVAARASAAAGARRVWIDRYGRDMTRMARSIRCRVDGLCAFTLLLHTHGYRVLAT